MHGLFRKKVDFGILPGGMEEVAMYTKGRERVYLKHRAGFIKYALQHGCD
jgi:2-acylglycerol O-acyltransferase 2